MISPETEQRIHQLLNAGISIRQIARQLKVGRNQIAKMARGERPNYAELRRLRKLKRARQLAVRKGPPQRCPECGYKVFMPCVLCTARAKQKKRTIKPIQPIIVPIGMQLRPTHEKRYQQVLAAKERRAARAIAKAERRRRERDKLRAANSLPSTTPKEET